MSEPLFMGISDACRRYGIGRTFLYELFQLDGCPPVQKLGAKTMLEVAAFDEFVRSQLRPATIDKNKRSQED